MASEILFPELKFVQNDMTAADITIRKKNFTLNVPEKGGDSFHGLTYWFDLVKRFALIRTLRGSDFRVNFSQSSICWRAFKKSSPEFARFILRGRAISLILPYLEPSLLLHSSVVVANGKGVGLCGDVGAGKTTLTAYFLNKGFSLLSDDLALIHKKNGGFVLEPGSPEIRLWPEGARYLNLTGLKGKPLFPEVKKLRFDLTPTTRWRFVERRVPLRRLYFLSRNKSKKIDIKNLQNQEALVEILRSAYNPFLKDPEILTQQFEMTMQLMEKIPIKRLSFPSGYAYLPKIHNAVLQDLES